MPNGLAIPVSLLLLFFVAPAAGAQEREFSRLDVEVGFGQLIHPGQNSRPSPGTASAGVAIWLTDAWGIAAVHVRGRGFSLNDPIREGSDRVFLGQQGLRYTRVGVRYRRELTPVLTLQVGWGAIVGGSRQVVELLKTDEGLVRSSPRYPWGSIFGGEAYVAASLGRHVRARFGVVVDGDPESILVQPTLGALIVF